MPVDGEYQYIAPGGVAQQAQVSAPQDGEKQANYKAAIYSTFLMPFSITLSSLSLSSTARTQTDVFLFVANDISIDSLHILFDATSTKRGVMNVSVVQNLGDGRYVQVTQPTTVDSPDTDPTEIIPQDGVLSPSRAVYLRVETLPDNGSTPWWAADVTKLHGTLHFLITD